MAPQVRKHLSNIEIDEISLVDRGANQHARTVIAKRAPEEENMPEFYSEDGELLPEDTVLNEGDVIYDESGQGYEFVLNDEDEGGEGGQEHQEEPEEEPQLVGKRFGQRGAGMNRQSAVSKSSKSFRDEFMEELSKAYSDDDRDAVIAKAFDEMQTYADQAEESSKVAKAERDLRLTREYISKAAEYNVPVDPDELGPVLYRMAETMDYGDCATIHKALASSGAAIFDEIGRIGGGDNADVMSQVQAYANENVSKSEDWNEASEITKAFEMNPQAYDEYLAEQRGF